MATRDCLVTNILQNIVLCVQQKKETYTGLKQQNAKAQISSVEMEYSSVAQKN